MNVARAETIRRKLVNLIDRCAVYPRQTTHEDSVGLAIFSRMVELHKSICLLVKTGHRRDAVILARTLCEAVLIHYWLTNRDSADRHDRYVKYWALVRGENISRIQKYFAYSYAPKNKDEKRLIDEAKYIFKKGRTWNNVTIANMANEPDEYVKIASGTSPNLFAQYELFYFWCSLVAHPTIVAIECFYPDAGVPFSARKKPEDYQILPETAVVSLATVWLFAIALRLNQSLGLRRDGQLDKIYQLIKGEEPS